MKVHLFSLPQNMPVNLYQDEWKDTLDAFQSKAGQSNTRIRGLCGEKAAKAERNGAAALRKMKELENRVNEAVSAGTKDRCGIFHLHYLLIIIFHRTASLLTLEDKSL